MLSCLLLESTERGRAAAGSRWTMAAGTSTELVQRLLNWHEQSKGLAVVKIVCGSLVILGGVWLIYTSA